MAGYKNYKAIVMSITSVDELMKAAFNIDGEVRRRGDKLSYHIRFNNRFDIDNFLEQMLKLDNEINENILTYDNASDVTEPAAKIILAKRLGVTKIERLLVDGDEQIILVNEERSKNGEKKSI